jgi:hypothetical protein
MTKIGFGSAYRKYPIPKKVKFWGGLIKIACKVTAGSSIIMKHEHIAIVFLFLDQATEHIMNFFGEKEDLNTDK